MKRTDPTKLTEANLMRAVLERRGGAVAYKTLAELEALGRPPRPAVDAMCETLIDYGYLVPAVAAKGNGVRASAKEHPALWALLISEHLAGLDAAQTAKASDAKGKLSDTVKTSVFLKKAAREARCAWTRRDDDLYGELAAQLNTWIAEQWSTAPTWVQRRRKSVERLCRCFDCLEYGDGARRHEEVKRKIEAGKQEEQAGETPDPADALDETMTEEMETDLKTQHELQAQVEVIGAGQDALAAQVAALLQQNGNGAPQ